MSTRWWHGATLCLASILLAAADRAYAVEAPHGLLPQGCESCHPTRSYPGLAGNTTLCLGCHFASGLAWSDTDQAIPGVSGSSHRWSAPVDNATYGAGTPASGALPLKVWNGQGWIVCSSCHNPHTQYYAPPDARAPQARGSQGRHYQRVENGAGQLCLECHAARDIQHAGNGAWTGNPLSHPVQVPLPSGPTFFSPPHDVNGLPQVEFGGSDADGNATNNVVLSDAGHGSYTTGDVECTSCHGVHYADSNSTTIDDQPRPGDGMLLHRANNDEACLGCHNLGIHNSDTMGTKYGTWGDTFDCRTCHKPHATKNINLVQETVSTPNSGDRAVDFRAASAGLEPYGLANATVGMEGSGPCEACHTQTTYYRNDASVDRTHNAGRRCTTCHQHRFGFKWDDNDCLSCHHKVQGSRRAVELDFARSMHHPLAYDREALLDPVKSNCIACHVERGPDANHKNGTVDHNSDPNGSGSSEWNEIITYPGGSTAYRYSWFCLDCHHAPNATDPSDPGQLGTESARDLSVYYLGSHINRPDPNPPWTMGPRYCGFCHFGDPQRYGNPALYETYGNAHQPAIGSPQGMASTSTVAPGVIRGEENTCLSCHGGYMNSRRYDADCPSIGDKTWEEPIAINMRAGRVLTPYEQNISNDQKPRFFRVGSIHLSADPGDGTHVCRTCHDPHQIGRYPNPPYSNPSQSIIFDPDNPTAPWTWTGNGTTPNDFCLRCHDGTQASPPLHSGLDLGGKQCNACHVPHGSTNRRLLYLSETEMAGITVDVNPKTPLVTVGNTLSFTATTTGVPADRRLDPVWTVTTLTGGMAPAEYTSTDGPIDIPDPTVFQTDGGIVSTINVPDTFKIYDLNVFVTMATAHGRLCDLSVILEHVDTGRRVLLEKAYCDDSTKPYDSRGYDQELVVAGVTRRGDERLDTFYGENAQGTWTLAMTDHWPGATPGTVGSFKLSFNNAVVGTVDANGLFHALAAGTATVRASIHSGRVRLVNCGSLWWEYTETEAAAGTDVTVGAGLRVFGSRAVSRPASWWRSLRWVKMLFAQNGPAKTARLSRFKWPKTGTALAATSASPTRKPARLVRTIRSADSVMHTPNVATEAACAGCHEHSRSSQ